MLLEPATCESQVRCAASIANAGNCYYMPVLLRLVIVVVVRVIRCVVDLSLISVNSECRVAASVQQTSRRASCVLSSMYMYVLVYRAGLCPIILLTKL